MVGDHALHLNPLNALKKDVYIIFNPSKKSRQKVFLYFSGNSNLFSTKKELTG